jgi:hypothetical protein
LNLKIGASLINKKIWLEIKQKLQIKK